MREFRNRDDAGDQLAALLKRKGYDRPIVLGIPRGGVPVAARVAKALNGELGVVVARKLRARGQAELAIGAVTADGVTWVNEEIASQLPSDRAYLEREIAFQQAEAAAREKRFDGRRHAPLKGRTVIVVDDGIATGATALAAARSVRAAGATRTVVAVPVGPPSTIAALRREADDVVCVIEEPDFWAVGQFYIDFRAVEDDEVAATLEQFQGSDTREVRVPRGGVELAVRLRIPPGRPPVVVFVHGLGSSKDSPRNVVIAERLVDRGIAALLFDLSGHGQSTGHSDGSIETFVHDLEAVERWLARQPDVDTTKIALAGSSLGAVVALQAATSGASHPVAMVLRAPPADPSEFSGLTVPTLLLVGSHDSLVHNARAAANASRVIELRVVEGASHLFEEPGTLEQATEITVSWLEAHLLGLSQP